MPTYEYRCQKCGRTFEKFQSMTDAPLKKCVRPDCGGRVERLIGAGAGLIFKGTGFYQTDYKRQKTEDSRQKTGDSRQKTEDSRQKTEDGRQKADKKEQKTESQKESKAEKKSDEKL